MRREWPLSTHLFDRLHGFRVAATGSLALLFFLAAACTNLGRAPSSVRNSGGTTGSFVDDVLNSGSFILVTVLPSQQSAGTQYDMIGTGNQFGVYCGEEVSACQCEYTYSNGNSSESVSATPTYVESDLIRCPNSVPSGVSQFTARIRTSDGTYFSNTVSVNLNNGSFANSSFYLDLSAMDSFVQVRRFQCKKREFITNPLDASTIDPIQSEDPKVIYPFNYYTTNVSESLLQMQRLGNQNWECTLTETKDRTLHSWANANVFSTSSCGDAFCAGDGEVMYPQTSLVSGKIPVNNPASVGKRRASFWLAKQAYGVFQIPLQAAIAPKDYVSATYGVIGYAAKPIPTQTGSSVCPSISMPTNATWVKVWNYRATDITPPKKIVSTQSANLSAIACNPGNTNIFPTCNLRRTTAGAVFGTTITSILPGSIASRVVVLDSAVGNANACYNVDVLSWLTSNEVWEPSPIAFGDPANGGLSVAQIQSLPWGMYSSAGEIIVDAGPPIVARVDNDTNGVIDGVMPDATPSDNQVTAVPLANDNYTDQIFIVTDPNVNDTSMRNQSSGVAQYRPVTYRTRGDCPGISRVGCDTSKEIHWDINVKEVGNPSSSDQYPLCVLQFYD